ncbi:hypothetical protein [Gorillibacterium timonense]|uniref:hypothetical protein n=1 Tax=Gorillibacterium timonense TaxID=1689269 RepID=UPI00131C54D4|nr:hypothetical protein [Gorillibacterium timonense]
MSAVLLSIARHHRHEAHYRARFLKFLFLRDRKKRRKVLEPEELCNLLPGTGEGL